MTKIIKPKNKPVIEGCEAVLYLDADEVDISDIEEKARAEGYREQTSRHATIIGGTGKDIKELIEKYPTTEQEKIMGEIRKLLRSFDWKFQAKEIYHIEKKGTFTGGGDLIEERESYIRAIDMPDMEKFYNELNKMLNANFPTQFPHITLFTRGERENPVWHGIGIGSKEKFLTLNPKQIN